ncbi:hypothetical protein BHE74_00008388 [Ensete ventricosum]|nr:hypothetical protein GW17_00019896 [Ensete ventricosum]RWW83128.1 hypothetical protein BHE74_00008388 [Ensete ventricosum]
MTLVSANTMVTGTVFCDQCKDGERGFFDYLLTDGFRGRRDELVRELLGILRRQPRPERLLREGGGRAFRVRCGGGTGAGADVAVPDVRDGHVRRGAAVVGAAGARWVLPQRAVVAESHADAGPTSAASYAAAAVVRGLCLPLRLTLWEALHGQGDLYRTLLREATASLLNSYNTLNFLYPALSVIDLMNRALVGSPLDALTVALRFRRANSGAFGDETVGCNFTPCRS